ncbi:MAG: hypothetical protein L3J46_06985, partial [Kangiellaceae bacterium]|nr:hypothetical protein [Kangiellaceae bacterium]
MPLLIAAEHGVRLKIMGTYTKEIKRNTERINALHSRIHETVKERDINGLKNKEWKEACESFHKQYDA